MKLELSSFVGQPCRSRIAYEFVPKKDYGLDMGKTARLLRSREVFVEIETPYLLMLKLGGHDVSLFKSGKIIVKSTNHEGEARRIAKRLVEKAGD
ncbi:MAG: hypothetical protein HY544_01625 [Candidatus Diapherotrites archaeon]|uniref:Uncharacterized protein n=1 Tax=Candidatus Iainarchaeum sp. TaxID=3101447 RepID=A0A8T3YM97_9ARCH|nr:hypothetical protein [Candidatus Diapherotrites archaeon]